MPDLHNAAAAFADDEAVDTDFVHHLVRGSELLKAGREDAAREVLERALQLRPRNQQGQSLLALSYFRLGLFDRAEEIYRALAKENPSDASLRVNLGLVHLKAGRSSDAVASFIEALDLSPTHRKAQGYLGLAYAQLGEWSLAREWFDRSGNAAMSARMSEMLRKQQPMRELDASELSLVEGDASFPTPMQGTPGPVADWNLPVPAPEITNPGLSQGTLDIAAYSFARRIESVNAAPFAVTKSMVMVEIPGDIYCRLDGLVATVGTLNIQPEFKRFRGRHTNKPFGIGRRRMMRIAGPGRLWIASAGRHFAALEVGDEPAFFREDALFAFQETLPFENGRVPSKLSADLDLVQLRGRGRALLASRYVPRSLEVSREAPCRVPLDVLLGWHGSITPRMVPLIDPELNEGELVPAVELSGEGRVLLDVVEGDDARP